MERRLTEKNATKWRVSKSVKAELTLEGQGEGRVHREGWEVRPDIHLQLFVARCLWLAVLRSSKGTLLQASEGWEVLGKTTRTKSPVKNIFLIIFSLKIIDLFIFLIDLSVINKLSYYGRIKNLKFRWTISKIFFFF